jgi:dihydrofolate synthase/folylpolyglutamate synthase
MEAKEALDKISSYERFGSVLGLERIKILLERLGNPEKSLKILHIAGTNGKGSVSRFLYEGIQANGYRAGLYTSPFLEVFNERIEADGRMISDEELADLTDRVTGEAEKMVEEGMDSPTEFEVVTAIAFLFFQEKELDYVVLEVGLGGRGDSTNVIDAPLISVITSISMDHMDRLGNTLEEIAGEKAGIIKPGIPVVMNVNQRDAARVIASKAYKSGSKLFDVSPIPVRILEESLEGSTLNMELFGTDYSDVRISMAGRHQTENIKTALAALEILRKNGQIRLQRDRLYEGVLKARQPGRMELMAKDPMILLDGAHNQAGAAALAEAAEYLLPKGKIRMIIGALADKDVEGMIGEFLKITKDFIATEPNNERRMTAGQLSDIINDRGGNCKAIPEPAEALKKALSEQEPPDVLIAAGSLYLIGQLRGFIKNGIGK